MCQQCITFHVESADLGFLIRVLNLTGNGSKTTNMEVRVVRLTGEVKTDLSVNSIFPIAIPIHVCIKICYANLF